MILQDYLRKKSNKNNKITYIYLDNNGHILDVTNYLEDYSYLIVMDEIKTDDGLEVWLGGGF